MMKKISRDIRSWQTLFRMLSLLVVLALLLQGGIVVNASSQEPLPVAEQEPAPKAVPATPNQVSPSGVINTATPTYTWNEVAGATHYLFFINDNGVATNVWWYDRAEALCNGYSCSVKLATSLTAGREYEWYVLAKDDTGYSSWSGPMTYGYGISAPSMPDLLTPEWCITGTANPTYTWSAVSTASDYLFFIYDVADNVAQGIRWYTASEANCANGTGTCSVTPSTSLSSGDYYYWVLARNLAGDTWSYGQPFTYGTSAGSTPEAPVLSSPSGSLSGTAPLSQSYTWQEVDDATDYLFYVEDRTESPTLATRVGWYTDSAAGCNGTTCSVTPTGLEYGSYRWYALAKNKCGYSDWSSSMSITYYPATLSTPVLRSPIDGEVVSTSTPTYTWDKVDGADKYYLYLMTSAGAYVADATYTKTEAGCYTGNNCSVNPTSSGWGLTDGNSYRWNLTAMTLGGTPASTTASDEYFTYSSSSTLPAPTNLTVTPRNPAAPPGPVTPTFNWTAVSGATSYRVDVTGEFTQGTWQTSAVVGCTPPDTTCTWTPGGTYYSNGLGLDAHGDYTLTLQAMSSNQTSVVASQAFRYNTSSGPSALEGYYEAAPAAPTNVTPAAGTIDVDEEAAIPVVWTSADYTEAPDYEVAFYATSVAYSSCTALTNCQTFAYTDTAASCDSDNSCTASPDISAWALDSTQYYWMVRAVNAWGNGTWSTPTVFTTDNP